MSRLRLLVDQPADAAWNMAVDEALLLGGSEPALRLYGWAPHAVSLGYFQSRADFGDVGTDTPVVRRLTGGGAIHHGDEITFALILAAERLPNDIAASYRLLHDAAIAALRDSGVACDRASDGDTQHARPNERWCFAAAGRDDVVTARGKLLGSAQRRVQRPEPRILHHGSLVLARPKLTPFVAAAEDAVELDPAAVQRLRAQLAARLAAALGCELAPDQLSADERALAERLRATRYGNPAFTDRR